MKNKRQILRRALAVMLAAALLPCMPALAESQQAVVAKENAPAFEDPALKDAAGILPQFAVVDVSAVSGKLAQIEYGGKTLYTGTSVLEKLPEDSVPATVAEATRVYQTPDLLSRSAVLKRGTKLNVLHIAGGWAMVERGGKVGYTDAASLSADAQADADPFLPEEDTGSGKSNVTIEKLTATVNKDALTVYQSASTKAKKLGTLKKGQEVTVQAYTAQWACVSMNGKYGFCQKSGLSQKNAAVEVVDELSGAVKASVTAAGAKVYASADEKSKLLGTLQKGAQINLLQTDGEWAYIELNGKYGYCAQDALNREGASAPSQKPAQGEVIDNKQPVGTATVIVESAPIYAKRSTSGAHGTAKLGDTLSYYGYDSKWVLVGKDGSFGFVPRPYLNAETYAELQNEDSGAAVLEMEKLLLKLGHLDGVPSTNFTTLTQSAVKRAQAACNMTQSGQADVALLRLLYAGKVPASPMLNQTISSGSARDNVTRLQTRLHALGYLSRSGSIDGGFGATTTSAVKLFQKAAKLSVTGTADAATLRALYAANAPALPSGTDAADATPAPTGGSSGNKTDIGSNLSSNTSNYDPSMPEAKKIEHVIYTAQQQLGKRYVFGAEGLATFDCSGLTMYAFRQVGVSLPHSAYSQGYNDNRTKISNKSSLRRGDLVFFNTVSDGDQCDHVGIYLGNNQFIHASSGAGKVVISDLSSGYYSRVFSWGRRVLG